MTFKKIILGLMLTVYVPICALAAETLLFSQAYDLAILNSSGVKAKEYKYEANKEEIKASRASLFPQINLSGYYRKSEYKSGFTKDVTRQGLFNAAISIDQVIFDQKNYTRLNLQKMRAKYFKVDSDKNKQQLASEVFQTYLNVMRSKNRVAMLESTIEYQRSVYEMYQKKFTKHLANKMDMLEAKVQINASEIELSKEQKLLEIYRQKLRQYVGDIDYTIKIVDMKKNILPIMQEMEKMVAKGDKESLEELSYKINMQTAQKGVSDAYSGYFPSVTLKALYSRYKTDTPSVDAPYDYQDYVMVNINIPIYSGGYTMAKVEAAKLEYKAAQEEYNDVVKQQNIDYRQNFALFEASKDSVKLYKMSYDSAKEFLEAVEQGYRYKLKSIVDLNKAKKDLFDVKYKYVDNLYQLIDSYIKLLLITNNVEGIAVLDKIVADE